MLPDGRPLSGRVSLKGKGEGSMRAPVAELTLVGDRLHLAEHDLGLVNLDATVANKRADVELSAARFGLTAHASADLVESYPGRLDARVANLDLAALPLSAPDAARRTRQRDGDGLRQPDKSETRVGEARRRDARGHVEPAALRDRWTCRAGARRRAPDDRTPDGFRAGLDAVGHGHAAAATRGLGRAHFSSTRAPTWRRSRGMRRPMPASPPTAR